ncbi:MAG: response regulator [Lachnospiraceae bacterium]|nr:response regulator [Lachnospiraceae bacterium]
MIFSIKARLREEAAFRETLEKLSDSQSAKDDFLANVSHELRTPLNTVVGVSEHLADSQVPDDMRRDVNDILTAGKNLMYMVSDIVDFTELHSGKIFLVENDYSLIGIVDDLKKMADFWNQEKGLELKFDLDPNICRTLKGDSQKIYRILLCLTNNAIKFTSSGNVHVKAEGRREGDLENLLITIADTGRGMSSDEIDKLDEVYNQLDTTRSREEGGIGLGIPISAKLVEAMNGFMHFESRKGKDTKVTIVLPQKITDPAPLLTAKDASDEHEKPEESGRSIINDTSTPAILVVDDSKMNLRVAQMELKKFGFTADTAQSGPESIKMVRQNDYKLIFMDHMMPEMDGVQTLNEIRKLDTPVSATVPIVALTANALGEAREMLLAAGFSDFISKPIERSQMERVLKKFMHYGEN